MRLTAYSYSTGPFHVRNVEGTIIIIDGENSAIGTQASEHNLFFRSKFALLLLYLLWKSRSVALPNFKDVFSLGC